MEHHNLTYKIATDQEEMEQIYQLNYETFVEEIPQHPGNQDHHLIDKFDKENIYFIAKDEDEVVGMITVRANRPFSLDQKLDNLDEYLPNAANPCEVRLLTIKRKYRKSRVFYQLVYHLVSYCLEQDYNMAFISGTDRQIKLYKKIGFEPFGPLVGTKEARFQPMYITKEKFETSSTAFRNMMKGKKARSERLNFLPGPVAINREVKQALNHHPTSHRSNHFVEEVKMVRERLCRLVNAEDAQIIVGTGTLANDVVAAQIKQLPGKGLILANGEFGYRLIDHAERMKLPHEKLEKQWNEKIPMEEIVWYLETRNDIQWIWTVHCETSTGYLYDLNELKTLANKYNVKLCIDACSSVGVVPVDLTDVYLASTVSGKGLGSYPGLAIVFHQLPLASSKEIPRYLDLGQYAEMSSIPYTHSSNLISALNEAVKRVDMENKPMFAHTIKRMLTKMNYTVLGGEDYSPGIITIPLSDSISSKEIGDQLKEKGILISYESDYLLKRNWIHFALMGDLTLKDVETAFSILQTTIDDEMKKVLYENA